MIPSPTPSIAGVPTPACGRAAGVAVEAAVLVEAGVLVELAGKQLLWVG